MVQSDRPATSLSAGVTLTPTDLHLAPAPTLRPIDTPTTLRGIPDLLAFLVAVPAGVVLALKARSGLPTLSASVFAAGLALMLGTSGLYHTFAWNPRVKDLWARLDHAAIYIMISGSYTPFCLATDLAGGPYLLSVVWVCALLGALYCLLRPRGSRAIRATIYVLLGVMMVPFAPSLYSAIPAFPFVLSLCGGASYIVGACVYVAGWPNPVPRHYGHHEVFHLFVFAGAATHYFVIWQLLVPQAQ